ncbi:MAG: TolC family protein [Muribaculaceae bacterium]|nr:TolC family protein [Muribaculaceae bacterium]
MKRLIMIVLTLLPGLFVARADKLVMTLDRAIALARVNSVDAAVALNELRASYWQYRSYRADLLPEVNFNATMPSYSKRYSSYLQSDGSYTFVRTSNLGLAGTLSMTQKLWFTGGTVSLQSSFDMMRQLGRGAYSR